MKQVIITTRKTKMKKYLFILLIFISTTFANTTNDQILKKLNQIEHNQELLKQEMQLRFEAVDKRFEAVDKRFEMMQHNMDKRFEAVDKRFEAVDKRFETLINFMMALTAGIFGLIGFMMWDRRTVVEKAKKECVKEVEQSEAFDKKADKEYVERLIKAMNELLILKDETARNVFKKYGLI